MMYVFKCMYLNYLQCPVVGGEFGCQGAGREFGVRCPVAVHSTGDVARQYTVRCRTAVRSTTVRLAL